MSSDSLDSAQTVIAMAQGCGSYVKADAWCCCRSSPSHPRLMSPSMDTHADVEIFGRSVRVPVMRLSSSLLSAAPSEGKGTLH